MRIPSMSDEHVRSFCHHIVADGQPVYVPVQPLPGKPVNECFSIVPQHIASYGGEQLVGWSIWEWRLVLIQAEFHAIWKNPNGILIDLTPKMIPVDRILFVSDPSRQYEGIAVDNVRRPLAQDSRVQRYCNLWHDRFVELNKGDLANQYGYIIPPADVAFRLTEIEDEMLQLEHAITIAYGREG